MKVADALQGVPRLFLDTAPVIYYVERHPQYASVADDIFDRIEGDLRAGAEERLRPHQGTALRRQRVDG